MNLIMLGPPGAGKGTVASRLKDELGLPHVSTGDLFRYHMKNETSLGIKVKTIIDSGELVPDEITTEMVKVRCSENDIRSGIILDGYPRTIAQANSLDNFLHIDAVINYELDDSEIVKRLSGRRLCRNCGAGYHVEFLKPEKENLCDKCGSDLYTRDDDKEESIRNRLVVYKNLTEPLIEYYTDKGILVSIDASKTPDTVLSDTLTAVRKR